MLKLNLQEYLIKNGRSPFNEWLEGLRDLQARARVETRLDRASLGNLGDYASIGSGVFELRIFHGPGYRVYCSLEKLLKALGLRLAVEVDHKMDHAA